MTIKVTTGIEVIRFDDGNIHSVNPILNANIDISLEEMQFLRSKDKFTFDVLMNILRHTSSEISRGVQIS